MTDQNPDLPASSDECTGALFGLILIFGSFFLYNPISKWLHFEPRPAPALVVTSAPAYNVANLPQLRAGEVIDFTDGGNRTALIAAGRFPNRRVFGRSARKRPLGSCWRPTGRARE